MERTASRISDARKLTLIAEVSQHPCWRGRSLGPFRLRPTGVRIILVHPRKLPITDLCVRPRGQCASPSDDRLRTSVGRDAKPKTEAGDEPIGNEGTTPQRKSDETRAGTRRNEAPQDAKKVQGRSNNVCRPPSRATLIVKAFAESNPRRESWQIQKAWHETNPPSPPFSPVSTPALSRFPACSGNTLNRTLLICWLVHCVAPWTGFGNRHNSWARCWPPHNGAANPPGIR